MGGKVIRPLPMELKIVLVRTNTKHNYYEHPSGLLLIKEKQINSDRSFIANGLIKEIGNKEENKRRK